MLSVLFSNPWTCKECKNEMDRRNQRIRPILIPLVLSLGFPPHLLEESRQQIDSKEKSKDLPRMQNRVWRRLDQRKLIRDQEQD